MTKKLPSQICVSKYNFTKSFVLILFLLFSITKAAAITINPNRFFSYENGNGCGFPKNAAFQKGMNCPTPQNPFLNKLNGNLYTLNSNFFNINIDVNANPTIEKHRIWLNFTNASSGNFSQTLVGYIEGATDGYDAGYDGLYFGDNEHSIYSLLNNEPYTIQAFALPFEATDVIPLGIITTESGEATIAIDHVDGLFLNEQPIYLEDLLLNVVYDIKAAPYTFQSEIGTFNNRFLLRFSNSSLSTINQNSSDEVNVYSKNQEIKIKSNKENIKKVSIYDVLGRQIFENNNVNNIALNISNLIGNQTLVVKITLETGRVITKKMIN